MRFSWSSDQHPGDLRTLPTISTKGSIPFWLSWRRVAEVRASVLPLLSDTACKLDPSNDRIMCRFCFVLFITSLKLTPFNGSSIFSSKLIVVNSSRLFKVLYGKKQLSLLSSCMHYVSNPLYCVVVYTPSEHRRESHYCLCRIGVFITCIVRIHGGHCRSQYWQAATNLRVCPGISVSHGTGIFASNFDKASP